MASKLTPYYPPTPIQSVLLKKAPDSIPPTNELELLHDELRELRKMSLARSKKAGEDLKAIEESMRRMKEKEKGKAKAIDKVKRERDFSPSLEVDDAKSVSSYSGHKTKSRLSSHPIQSFPPSARSSLDPRRSAADDLKKKKKKRKREFEDSDAEREIQRPRKTTPPVVPHVQVPPPPKAQKSVVSSVQPHVKPPPGPDFSVPQPYALLPLRPPIPPPPLPGPSKPTEVMEDFSKSRQPSQIAVTTFYTSIEPWLRNIREEDVGFLEHTGDEVEPYILPKLGRHYLEVWEDQDAGLIPPVLVGLGTEPSEPPNFAAPTPKWDPSTLTETDLLTEERGHGPLTERVISALLPNPDQAVWKGVKAAEDAMEGRPGGSGAAAARKERLNVTDLEVRIRDTMRYHGLLEGVPDYSEKVDDPIATALRQAQRELRRVVATNKARKARLVDIARDRLGYQEYLECRDSLDKNITNLYAKLQRKDVPKIAKKKKQTHQRADSTTEVAAAPVPCPAALGLHTDEELQLHISEQLQQLVKTRREWVDEVGSHFERLQREQPGRIWGFPQESIYKGIEEEVQAMLNQTHPDFEAEPPRTNSIKGKAKERGDDEMDVG